jgi:hypothetical protein
MLRSTSSSLSIPVRLLTLLPLALFAAACSGGESRDDNGAAGGMQASGGEASSAGDSASAGSKSGASAAAGDTGVAGDSGVGGAEGAALGPAAVDLGTAQSYAIVAKSKISNVPTSVITGDLALSPAAASYITGFALKKAGTSWSSAQVTGQVFAANNDPPTPTELTVAVGDMQTAYTDAAGRPSPDFLNLGAGSIGGLTLKPGLYKWTSTLTIPTDVTLEGGANDVWIFQVTGDLKLAAAKQMILSGGAEPRNIFWQVAGLVDLGTTSHAEGIVLSKTAITLETGSSINGRLFAQTAVTLASATVAAP